MKVLAIFGTRPEAIKRAPPLRALKAQSGLECIAVLIGQHRQIHAAALMGRTMQKFNPIRS